MLIGKIISKWPTEKPETVPYSSSGEMGGIKSSKKSELVDLGYIWLIPINTYLWYIYIYIYQLPSELQWYIPSGYYLLIAW